MATNHTTNYQLNQWEATDQVLRTDFNEDNAKIDAALKSQADSIAALNTQLTSGLAEKGNCRIMYQTYVGTGQCTISHPTQLTFPGQPLVVMVTDGGNSRHTMLAVRGCLSVDTSIGSSSDVTLTWSGNTVSWYNYNDPSAQMNVFNSTYHVVALLAADA